MQRRGKKTDPNSFARRHIGPSEDEVGGMLREVGFESLNTLVEAAVPKNIRLDRELSLPEPKSEMEALAAAEPIALRPGVVPDRKTFFVADNCHPQTVAVVQTRAKRLGITIKVGDYSRFKFDDNSFGALVQYPATDGAIYDYTDFIKGAHDAGALVVVAADILALTLLKPPGEFGADVAFGNTQRFGVP